jgi:hypothetical protein
MDHALMDPLGVGRERQESPDPFGRLRSFVGGTEQFVSVLNGVFGHLLDERRPALALPMTFRSGGAELRLDREALADATSAVCVFAPGLMSSDAVWRFRAAPR